MDINKYKRLTELIERLKIERDAILRSAEDSKIKYDKQITELIQQRIEV